MIDADAPPNPATPAPGSVQIVKLLMVKEKTVKYNQSLSCADMVVQAVRPLFKDSYREMIVVVGLNNLNFPTILHIVGLGNQLQAFVTPANIFKPLLLSNASSFILVHNHPSGSGTLKPSNADMELTRKIEYLGKNLEIPLLDHLILNADCSDYCSFKRLGLLSQN